jgi:hypothetical protein
VSVATPLGAIVAGKSESDHNDFLVYKPTIRRVSEPAALLLFGAALAGLFLKKSMHVEIGEGLRLKTRKPAVIGTQPSWGRREMHRRCVPAVCGREAKVTAPAPPRLSRYIFRS